MKDGQTLWATLVGHYDRGVATVAQTRRDWQALKPLIDRERWAKTDAFLSRARAVCWSCMIVEGFRHDHPDLFIERPQLPRPATRH